MEIFTSDVITRIPLSLDDFTALRCTCNELSTLELTTADNAVYHRSLLLAELRESARHFIVKNGTTTSIIPICKSGDGAPYINHSYTIFMHIRGRICSFAPRSVKPNPRTCKFLFRIVEPVKMYLSAEYIGESATLFIKDNYVMLSQEDSGDPLPILLRIPPADVHQHLASGDRIFLFGANLYTEIDQHSGIYTRLIQAHQLIQIIPA